MKMIFAESSKLESKLMFMANRPRKDIISDQGQRGDTFKYNDIWAVFICVEKIDEHRDEIPGEAAEKVISFLAKHQEKNKIIIVPFAHLTNKLANPKIAYNIIKEVHRRLIQKGLDVREFGFGWHRTLAMEIMYNNDSLHFEEI